MPRLIDADALMEDIRKNSASYFADDFAHEWVDKQSTVDAVPIDWLKKKYPLTGVVGTESYFRTAHIVHDLIEEWEKENIK